MSSLTIGNPAEWREFEATHPHFSETLKHLHSLCERVFLRDVAEDDIARHIVFALGRLSVEDFMEIVVVCGNGYGVAGLKLLRAMFERAVTAKYLADNPGEAIDFFEYHYVHQRKLVNHARDAGIDLRRHLSERQILNIEENYDRVKAKYSEPLCVNCGTSRIQLSWTKKDLRTLASEVGLQRAYVSLYFWPMLQYHTTMLGMDLRFRETEDGKLSFRWESQRKEADFALCGAHTCLAIVLEHQNEYFALGLAEEIQKIRDYYARCWPGAALD